jgi:CsoR family transcriptional regulator, copper-sensing transcriptional repressor
MKNSKSETLINFKKANSLLEKIIIMTEEKKYCIDIMQQNLAAIGLLKSANQKLLEGHLNTCFKKVMASNNEAMKKKMIAEILQVTKLTNK